MCHRRRGAREINSYACNGVVMRDRAVWICLLAAGATTAAIGILQPNLYLFYALYYAAALFTVAALALTVRGASGGAAFRRIEYAYVGLTALATRCTFLWWPQPLSIDRYGYHDFERFLSSGLLPYKQFFFAYPQGAALLFAGAARVPHISSVWQSAMIVCDVLVALLMTWYASSLFGPRITLVIGLAYGVAPFPVIESGLNAHIDTLVAAFFIVACWLFVRKRSFAGFVGAFAALLKGWPVVTLPLIFAASRDRSALTRAILLSIFAALITTLPFIGAAKAIVGYWYTLLPVPGAGSLAGAIQSVPFYQNSLKSLAAHIPLLARPISLYMVAFVAAYTLAFAALLGWNGAERWWAFSRRRSEVLRTGSIAAFTLLALAGIGLALIGVDTLVLLKDFNYHDPWWFAPASQLPRGVALIALGIALPLAGARGALTEKTDETCLRLLIIICTSAIVILVHGNNFGWYMLPLFPVAFLLTVPGLRWMLVGALLAFYPSYPTASFSNIGDEFAIRHPYAWSVRADAGPDLSLINGGNSERYKIRVVHDVLLLQPLLHKRYIVANFHDCNSGSSRVVVGRSHVDVSIAGGIGVLEQPSSDTAAAQQIRFVDVRPASCGVPEFFLLPEIAGSVKIAATGGALDTSIVSPLISSGWNAAAYATGRVNWQVGRHTVFVLDQRSNYDASFGGRLQLSIWLSGIGTNGKLVENMPIIVGDRTSSIDYVIHNRYPLAVAEFPLAKIDRVRVEVKTTKQETGVAKLLLRNLGFLEEN